MAFPKNELFPEFDQRISVLGRALGHPARVFIMRLLREEGPKQFYKLVKRLPLNEGTVTSHLRTLRKSGLIDVEVNGLVNVYKLSPEGVEAMFGQQTRLFELLIDKEHLAIVNRSGSEEAEEDTDDEGDAGYL